MWKLINMTRGTKKKPTIWEICKPKIKNDFQFQEQNAWDRCQSADGKRRENQSDSRICNKTQATKTQ